MAENNETPSETLPLSREFEVETLPANRLVKFDLVPSEQEIEALKALFGLTGLKKMRLIGEIAPMGARSWQLEAMLGATVSQVCIVSAEPVRTRIDVPVRVKFVPENKIPFDTPENELDEDLEPLGKTIDIGIVATESLGLAIPLYPRKDGATLQNAQSTPKGAAPITDEDLKPFAGLASLKDKLGEGGE